MANELARLSKENSELRLELEKYKKNEGVPELSVLFNDSNELSLIYPESIEGLIPKFQCQKIDKNEIKKHLLPFINDNEIEEFNSKVPSLEKVNDFNREKTFYELILNHKSLLEISVMNIGETKAKEIYIDIEFPEEIKVFTKDFLGKLNEPNLYIPKNPLIKANEEYIESENPTMRAIKELSKFSSIGMMQGLNNTSYALPIISIGKKMEEYESILLNNQNKALWVENNKISIHITDLLHTRKITLPHKIYMSPLKEGNFLIRYSVMCEQFKEPQKIEVPLIITKKQSGI